MGKGKKKTPEYTSTSFDSSLWGSSNMDKSGMSYTPTSWMNATMGTVADNYNKTLQSMVNNDFTNDKNFQAYQNRFNDQMTNYYNNNILNDLARRGLIRSSGLQAANTDFANTLADRQLDLYDNYYNRLNNNLAAMQGSSNTLYNYMTGITNANQNVANAVNNYQLEKAAADAKQSGGNPLMGGIQGAMNGAAAGGSMGGGWGALGGAVIGGVGGALASR
ncbi:hypothetical protein IKP85_06675 [bacterium]|nr:hypothetical protein [bacterium]